jgi:hypothetical protein
MATSVESRSVERKEYMLPGPLAVSAMTGELLVFSNSYIPHQFHQKKIRPLISHFLLLIL